MNTLQILTDKIAIGLSLACAIHCLALPLLLVLIPSLSALQLDNENFHFWMVIAVIPTSAYALSMGCKKHKKYRLLFMGLIGLALLIAAISIDEEIIGESGEKILTLAGASILAIGHFLNFRLCQKHEDCKCD